MAFDLDDTLISSKPNFLIQKPVYQIIAKMFHVEHLRKNTTEIFHFCKKNKIETWIYTTSFRSKIYIYFLFLLNGIKLQGVVNQNVHNKKVKHKATKYPPVFGIDLLIDDSEGVKKEGELYGFDVLCIKTDDQEWIEKVKQKIIEKKPL
jgi:hypothetical protein